MTDLILGSELSEFVANRQYAKIQYLQQENEQLQEQLRDLERALKLNKEVLRLAFDSNSNVNNSNNSTNDDQTQQKQILLKLHEENDLLRQQYKKLLDGRNTAQNRVLLQQQIAEESLAFYKDMISELDDKLVELRRCIQDKEYTIQDIEKNRGTQENGHMVKIREIVTPNEQTLRLHEELESTRQILNKLSQESQHLQEQNQELRDANSNFKRELIKLRIVLRSPVAYYKMKEFIYDDYYGNTDNNLELQNEIYANPGYGSQDYQPQQQQDILKQYGYQQQPQSNIKYLSNNERAIYQEKLQKSESLLKGFKELFEREKNKTALLSQQVDELRQKLEDSYYSNDILIKSVQAKDAKVEQLQHEATYFRGHYNNYLFLLKNKKQAKLNLSFDKSNTNQQPNKAPQKKAVKQDLHTEGDVQVNVSILDEPEPQKNLEMALIYDEDDEGISPNLISNKKVQLNDDDEDFDKQFKATTPNIKKCSQPSQYQMNIQECRQFLLNTAKELYLQYNLRMNNLQKKKLMEPSKWAQPLPIWHQKSSSDPLDYFTLNFQNLQISDHKNMGYDEEIANIRRKKAKNDMKKHPYDPFTSDMSMIAGTKGKVIPVKKVPASNNNASFISNDGNLLVDM